MNNRRRAGLSLGTSTILVTFVLLCITTFATMSLISANADHKLTVKQAEGMADYYAADADAEKRLGQIRDAAVWALTETDTAEAFFDTFSSKDHLWSNWQRNPSEPTAELTCIISVRDQQQLEVIYTVRYFAESHTAQITCLSHQVRTLETGESGGDFLDLWAGPDGGLATPENPLGGS